MNIKFTEAYQKGDIDTMKICAEIMMPSKVIND